MGQTRHLNHVYHNKPSRTPKKKNLKGKYNKIRLSEKTKTRIKEHKSRSLFANFAKLFKLPRFKRLWEKKEAGQE